MKVRRFPNAGHFCSCLLVYPILGNSPLAISSLFSWLRCLKLQGMKLQLRNIRPMKPFHRSLSRIPADSWNSTVTSCDIIRGELHASDQSSLQQREEARIWSRELWSWHRSSIVRTYSLWNMFCCAGYCSQVSASVCCIFNAPSRSFIIRLW